VLLGGRVIRSSRVTARYIFNIYKPREERFQRVRIQVCPADIKMLTVSIYPLILAIINAVDPYIEPFHCGSAGSVSVNDIIKLVLLPVHTNLNRPILDQFCHYLI
jgi:hypothetical protein